ncbi:glycosyltransferase family 1 protein [Geodermatophilus sp. DSM 44513]|uniref:glycosyltransferase family 4 protein n=1 Tax=Geodermatophilus sp. DSM 44513 TaxID=1528104 RepID=UPI001271608A|nr:glycosyltransferase family 1 protein [Geodermatophilus sp. DSM 44513]WNV75911.1 glycosyltransferase family 1 protein [Geodermatophilus sp. DSM 44513]
MRVVVVTESFLPQVNGVTNSVLRVCEQLQGRGAEVLVVAPGQGPTEYAGARVARTPSVRLPGYAGFRVGRPWPGMTTTLRDFRPDVVHLASPAWLGAQAARTARRLGVPVVAVHQTDLVRFTASYGVTTGVDRAVWARLRRVYGSAACTLAPSRATVEELQARGVPRVRRWARGVDTRAFSPAHRDLGLRRRLAPRGELLVGYVGRLAREKEVHLLAALQGLPDVRLVVVGDGPQRAALEQLLPGAAFPGFLGGAELSRTVASLDVFVHTGSSETYCQAAQEALASAVPVVAPAAGGLLDVVADGHTGLLFEPGSAADLRRRVEQLTTDPDRRNRMSRAARWAVRGRTWEAVGAELVGHYADALGRPGPAAVRAA